MRAVLFSAKLQQALSERKEGGDILGREKRFTAETHDEINHPHNIKIILTNISVYDSGCINH